MSVYSQEDLQGEGVPLSTVDLLVKSRNRTFHNFYTWYSDSPGYFLKIQLSDEVVSFLVENVNRVQCIFVLSQQHDTIG